MSKDPYGISLAEKDFEASEKLVRCAESEVCPEHAAALFWLAAMNLSQLSAIEIEMDTSNFKTGMQELIDAIISSSEEVPDYDVSLNEFQDAYLMMKKSHDLGEVMASNELGLLHMQDPNLLNLELAEIYLKAGYQGGDGHSAFNLARLEVTKDPSNLKYIV